MSSRRHICINCRLPLFPDRSQGCQCATPNFTPRGTGRLTRLAAENLNRVDSGEFRLATPSDCKPIRAPNRRK